MSIYYLYKRRIKLWNYFIYGIFLGLATFDFLLERFGLYHDLPLIRFFIGVTLGMAVFHLVIISMNSID